MQVPAARKMNERIDDSDGFIGVKRKRNRIKSYSCPGLLRMLTTRIFYVIWKSER